MQQLLTFPHKVIAHRGASGYAPENTLAAFKKAIELNIAWVEFDVMQSSCSEVIIFHDELLDRTTSGKGEIDKFPYSFLKGLDAGSWFHKDFADQKILSLHDTLEFLNQHDVSVNIELKSLPGDEERLVQGVLDVIARIKPFKSQLLYSSFSIKALELLRKYSPDSIMGLLLHAWEDNWEEVCLSLQCQSVHTFEEIMTKEKAQYIKSLNKKLLCYTVNDPLRAKELFSWGVDAVFSDFPDKVKDEILFPTK